MLGGLLMLVTVLVFSCKQDDTQDSKYISTDVVNNPATASGETNDADLPEITFEEKEYEFQKVMQGEKVTWSYKYSDQHQQAAEHI